MSTEPMGLDDGGWPTTRTFSRTLSEAFRDPDYYAAVERPKPRPFPAWLDAVCMLLGFVLFLWMLWAGIHSGLQ